jgi:hypothetical protein
MMHLVTWQDAALYDLMDAAPEAPEGIPVHDFGVVSLREDGIVAGWQGGLILNEMELRLQARTAVAEDVLPAAVDAFLRATTTLDEAARDALVQDFAGSRTVVGQARGANGDVDVVVWSLPAPVPLALATLFDSLGEPPAQRVSADFWKWHIAFPVKSLDLDGATLRVAADGEARMEYEWPGGDRDAAIADAARRLQEAGFQAPIEAVAHRPCDNV